MYEYRMSAVQCEYRMRAMQCEYSRLEYSRLEYYLRPNYHRS
jgi:hypothetical protein